MMAAAPAEAVFFLHLSSAGGSSLCRLGQQQPCARVPACRANCNLNCAHPWDWVNYCNPLVCASPQRPCKSAYAPSCAGLRRYVRRRNLTIIASETMLPSWHRGESLSSLCTGFAYVTVLRDPVERLQSQLERMHPTAPNARLRSLLNASRSRFEPAVKSSLMGPAAVDNYLIRLLLGPDVFFLPLRAINRTHAQQAEAVLRTFAAAIPLDQLDAQGSRWLRAAFGWRGRTGHVNLHVDETGKPLSAGGLRHAAQRRAASRVGGAPGGAGQRQPHRVSTVGPGGRSLAQRVGSVPAAGPARAHWQQRLSERSLGLLRQLNRFDIELYERARSRFRLQTLPPTPILHPASCQAPAQLQCPDILLQRNASALARLEAERLRSSTFDNTRAAV